MTQRPMLPPVDLIWNMTLVCPYDCAICCVDAVHVSRHAGRIELRSAAESRNIDRDPSAGSIYEQAGRFRQREGLELDLGQKLRVLDHLAGYRPRLDFSGGDVLVMPENLDVIRAAAARFGRDAITITATSAGVGKASIGELKEIIGHFNFTFDGARSMGNRPRAYASSNIKAGRLFAEAGVAVRAELPLTRANATAAELTRIYETLHENGIGQILLMRLFPVGRGAARQSHIPSRHEYLDAIRHLRGLQRKHGGPQVRLQCALRHIEPEGSGENPCNAVTTSFGIAPDGTLLRSAWAVDPRGKPLDPSWVLGNVAKAPMDYILKSPRVVEMRERADENHGHCKVFAFLNGESADPEERFYETADPLFAESPRFDTAGRQPASTS